MSADADPIEGDQTSIQASAAAEAVLKKLTRSLLSQPRRSNKAPSRLSMRVPRKPARATTAAVRRESNPAVQPASANTAAEISAAAVPTKLIPPSTPGATGLPVVIRTVLAGKAIPSSLEEVSAAASARAASAKM